jgi:transposase-like protein
MRCPHCNSKRLVKSGRLPSKGYKLRQRYTCMNCCRTTQYPKR